MDSYQLNAINEEDDKDLTTLLSLVEEDDDVDIKKAKIVSDYLYPLIDALDDMSNPDPIIQAM